MAGTSRSDDDHPAPQGGGAAERLREFRAARGEPLEDAHSTTTDEMTTPPEDEPPEDEPPDDEPPDGGDRTGDDRADTP